MSVHLTTQKIIKEWTDYNNHMNVAYYVLIFDVHGAEVLMNKFKMGVSEGDDVEVNLTFFDHDKKRLLYKMEMIHKEKKYLASTIEILALYVDLGQRKVAEFEDEKIKIMDDYIEKNKSDFNNKDLKFSSKLKK